MQAPPTAPTAQGSFAKTPFPHLLVYALERALTGTFELHSARQSVATILVVQGVPAKIRLSEPVHFLGDIMAELGMVDPNAVRAAHERIAQARRLMGQVLKELGAADDARIEAGVRRSSTARSSTSSVCPRRPSFRTTRASTRSRATGSSRRQSTRFPRSGAA